MLYLCLSDDLSEDLLCLSDDFLSEDLLVLSSSERDLERDEREERVECDVGVPLISVSFDFDSDRVILVGGANWLKLMSSVLSYNKKTIQLLM